MLAFGSYFIYVRYIDTTPLPSGTKDTDLPPTGDNDFFTRQWERVIRLVTPINDDIYIGWFFIILVAVLWAICVKKLIDPVDGDKREGSNRLRN